MKIERKSIESFVKFFIAGGIATVADVAIFEIVYMLSKLSIAGHILGFLVGLVISYYLSAKYVFPNKSNEFKRDITVFTITSLIGLAISTFIIFILVDLDIMNRFVSNDNLSALLSKAVATAVVFLWNYYSKSKFVFNKNN